MEGTLTPSYGRDYKSKAVALADWNAGKDFMLNTFNGSGLCSRRDADKEVDGGNDPHLQLRWKNKTQCAIIKRGADGNWK